jgi:fucose 4-O-acetylase-like acetyltransferase
LEKFKLEDYSVMKVIGILLVVLGHATRMYTEGGTIAPRIGSDFLQYLTQYIYNFHMPVFVFVSGAIYFYVKQEVGSYKKFKPFITNKAKRLLIPYLVFGIFYVTPVMIFLKLTKYNVFKYILKNIVLSLDCRHLWYVFMLFNVFLIFFIIEKYINKIPKIITIVILLFMYLLSGKLTSIFQISATAQYLLFFYLGYLFQQNKNLINKIDKYFLPFILMFACNLLFLIISIYIGKYDIRIMKILKDLLYVGASVFGIYYVYFISLIISKTKIIENNLYKWLKKDGFGIYLFHPMIIYCIFYMFKENRINPFLMVFIAFSVSLILSDLATKLMRKIHLTIIIGEK